MGLNSLGAGSSSFNPSLNNNLGGQGSSTPVNFHYNLRDYAARRVPPTGRRGSGPRQMSSFGSAPVPAIYGENNPKATIHRAMQPTGVSRPQDEHLTNSHERRALTNDEDEYEEDEVAESHSWSTIDRSRVKVPSRPITEQELMRLRPSHKQGDLEAFAKPQAEGYKHSQKANPDARMMRLTLEEWYIYWVTRKSPKPHKKFYKYKGGHPDIFKANVESLKATIYKKAVRNFGPVPGGRIAWDHRNLDLQSQRLDPAQRSEFLSHFSPASSSHAVASGPNPRGGYSAVIDPSLVQTPTPNQHSSHSQQNLTGPQRFSLPQSSLDMGFNHRPARYHPSIWGPAPGTHRHPNHSAGPRTISQPVITPSMSFTDRSGQYRSGRAILEQGVPQLPNHPAVHHQPSPQPRSQQWQLSFADWARAALWPDTSQESVGENTPALNHFESPIISQGLDSWNVNQSDHSGSGSNQIRGSESRLSAESHSHPPPASPDNMRSEDWWNTIPHSEIMRFANAGLMPENDHPMRQPRQIVHEQEPNMFRSVSTNPVVRSHDPDRPSEPQLAVQTQHNPSTLDSALSEFVDPGLDHSIFNDWANFDTLYFPDSASSPTANQLLVPDQVVAAGAEHDNPSRGQQASSPFPASQTQGIHMSQTQSSFSGIIGQNGQSTSLGWGDDTRGLSSLTGAAHGSGFQTGTHTDSMDMEARWLTASSIYSNAELPVRPADSDDSLSIPPPVQTQQIVANENVPVGDDGWYENVVEHQPAASLPRGSHLPFEMPDNYDFCEEDAIEWSKQNHPFGR